LHLGFLKKHPFSEKKGLAGITPIYEEAELGE